MGERLTKAEVTALRWARECNARRVGYLGPTVAKYGPIPEYARLVEWAFLTCNQAAVNVDGKGYWITAAGREALKGHP